MLLYSSLFLQVDSESSKSGEEDEEESEEEESEVEDDKKPHLPNLPNGQNIMDLKREVASLQDSIETLTLSLVDNGSEEVEVPPLNKPSPDSDNSSSSYKSSENNDASLLSDATESESE